MCRLYEHYKEQYTNKVWQQLLLMAKRVSIRLKDRRQSIEATCDRFSFEDGLLVLYGVIEDCGDHYVTHESWIINQDEWIDLQVVADEVNHLNE